MAERRRQQGAAQGSTNPAQPAAAGPGRSCRLLAAALSSALAAASLTACMPAQQRPSWTIYPLSRHQPHDGLAVVSQPNGYGLHIWLQTDTRQAGICRPRWIVDAARLFNGNGTAPFSSGLASRPEFFEAVARPDVVRALRRELEQLCARRAPASTWQWQDPPRSPAEVPRSTDPFGDQEELQPLPAEIRRQEEAILRGDAPPTSP